MWAKADLERSRKKGGLEVYRSHRFFTVTGKRLAQYSPAVEERQE